MKNQKLVLVETGVANIKSVSNILAHIGVAFELTDDAKKISAADKIILPGVGSYGKVIGRIRERGLEAPLQESILQQKKPFLGICVGMQILSETGHEFGEHKGLGVLRGTVKKIDARDDLRLPHVGWNEIILKKPSALFKNIPPNASFYFLHSYVMTPADSTDLLCTTDYGSALTAAVERENIFGVQFHPEKSQEFGIQLIRNFVEL